MMVRTDVSSLACPIPMLVLGEINAMAGKRLPDLLRRFGCRSLRDPHRIDCTRRRPAFGERVCLRKRCRADRGDGQYRSIIITGVSYRPPGDKAVDLGVLRLFDNFDFEAVPVTAGERADCARRRKARSEH